MIDEFSKHRCLGQEWHRLLEAVEKTVSRSFLYLWFVVSQSVMLVERLFFRGAECVVMWRGCVVVYVCLCVCVCVSVSVCVCVCVKAKCVNISARIATKLHTHIKKFAWEGSSAHFDQLHLSGVVETALRHSSNGVNCELV